jgi:Terminase RNaseH-like domain
MLALKWKPDRVLVEDKASGQSLIQELQNNSRLPVHAIKVDSDKVTRATAVTPLVEAGKVFLPADAPWLADFLEEVSSFPAAPHDDMVDALSQALNFVRESNSGIFDFYRESAMRVAQGLPAIDPALGQEMEGFYEEARDRIREIENLCRKCGRPAPVGVDAGPLGRYHKECWEEAQRGTGTDLSPIGEKSSERAIVAPWQESKLTRPRVCESCAKPIVGTCTEIGAKKWHPECFPK